MNGQPQQCMTVAEDGAHLATRILGPENPDATIIFCHGYCLRSATWTRIVRTLAAHHPSARFVTYDQRGHGRSTLPSPTSATVEHLGRDLQAIIDAHAHGPIVVVGHSMGGMGVLAHAHQFPDIVANRYLGTVLVSTAPRGLAHCGLGAPFNRVPLAATRLGLALAPQHADTAKRWCARWATPALHAAQRHPVRRDYQPADCMATPSATIAAFLRSLTFHDQRAGIPVLATTHTRVVCGDCDIATPAAHNADLATALRAQLTILPGVGHLAHLEKPDTVIGAVVDVLSSARTSPTAYAAPASC